MGATQQYKSIDQMLETLTLTTPQTGLELKEVITPGQKLIGECILNRSAPNGKKRVHIMAHTRYGKSMTVGATVAIRAALKHDKWAIVAPTKEQAQIIMDYVIHFCVNDPLLSQNLKTNPKILREEKLTQRRSRDHITFLRGGEVRTFAATQTMGQGAPNIVLDEAGLISNSDEAKAFRMLGDSTDNFIVKIGNPWENNHFRDSYVDPTYYHINIDVYQGIKEGRITEEHHEAVKKKVHYDVLYLNQFPDDAAKDKWGYLPLLTYKEVMGAQVEAGSVDPIGKRILGGDVADGGDNMSAIVTRASNIARVAFITYDMGAIDFGDKVASFRDQVDVMAVDKLPAGNAAISRLDQAKETKRKLIPVNAGTALDPEAIEEHENAKEFRNLRAYIFWKMAQWIKQGGKLERHDDWKMLLAIKYKVNNGKLQIVSKEELRKNYQVNDLGVADALSFTFVPGEPEGLYEQPNDVGGVDPWGQWA